MALDRKKSVFEEFPQLETSRLRLREMRPEDKDIVFAFNSDPVALKYIARVPFTRLEQAEEKVHAFRGGFIDRNAVWWVFELKETGEVLGYGGLFEISQEDTKAEIGYGTVQKFWGQGYVGEAVAGMVRFGFEELKLHRIFGRVEDGNIPSARILQKLGFENEGLLRHDECAGGRYFNMNIWARLHSDKS